MGTLGWLREDVTLLVCNERTVTEQGGGWLARGWDPSR